MANNNTKKKGFLVGLGLFWVAAITAVGVSIPFAIKNNQTKSGEVTPQKDETEFVKTSLITNNEHQIQIKVTNLENYVGQWLKIEYKQQNSSNTTLVSASNAVVTRSFYVRNATEVVAIGGLVPNIKYDYFIKNQDGKTLSQDAVFWTYSKAELNTTADESSIRFISSELNKEYLGDSIVVRYKPFNNSIDAPVSYNNTKELAVAIELKEIEGRTFYAISGKITDLLESTPYVITMHVRGQEGTITDPVVAWTRGNNAKIIATNVTTSSTKAQVSGLDDYISSPNPLASFWIKYQEVANPTSALEVPITVGDEAVIEQPITVLKQNTQYSMTLIKLEDEIKEVLTKEVLFWTKPEPFIKSKTFEDFDTNWRKSDVNAFVVVSGLASKGGQAADSLNSSDLQVVAVEVASADAVANFSAPTAKKFDLNAADTTDIDDYPVKLTELTPRKMYALQVFKKTDTTFSDPMLEETFVNTQMPTLFTAETLDLTTNSVKIKVKNINNYKSNETILRYWKEGSPDSTVDKKIEFADNTTEVELALSSLEKNTKYKFTILPVYPHLQVEADNLLENQGEFKTLDILTAEGTEGNQFTDNIKFKLSGMDSQFPVGQEAKVQWRLKAAEPTTAWAAPSANDSFAFTVSSAPADGTYTIEVPNNNRIETWYTGMDYEWRVIKSSDVATNLIKEGTTEFNLVDDKVSNTFNIKIASANQGDITWRAPLVENIVAGALGDSYDKTIWREFFGLKTKTQWQHYLEWLAFQNDEIQNKAIENIVFAFKAYTKNKEIGGTTFVAVSLLSRFTAVPYPSSNGTSWASGGGAEENGTFQEFSSAADENTPKFGGYNNTEHPTAAPIKPSDFTGISNTFDSWENFPKAIKFTLNRIKDGWGATTPTGISRANMFATNIKATTLETTFASRINDKKSLDANFTLAAINTTDSNGWVIETLESAGNTNFWSNDLTGEMYVKVKATNGAKVHYYWTKITGFNKSTDDTTLPAESDLSFTLFPDHAKNARIINKEIELATTDAAKKALIEKYWQVNLSSQFTSGWTFVSVTFLEDQNSLALKVKIPTKVITKGVVGNGTDKTELTSDTEFTYTLKGYDLDGIPALNYGISNNQKAQIQPAASGIAEVVRFVNSNWTYEQMLNKMRDAVLKGDTEITALANSILSLQGLKGDFNNVNFKAYIRTRGGAPLANWGDFNWQTEPNAQKIDDSLKNGFLTPNALGTNNDATRLLRIVEMIKKYGEITGS